MSRLKTRLLAPVVALLLFSAAQVRAGAISWHYNWTPGSLQLFSDNGNTGGFVSFTSEPLNQAIGNSDIVATNLRTVSASTKDETFNQAGAYTLHLQVTDDASGQKGTVDFTGKLGGAFSANNAQVTNKFTGQTVQQLSLGGNTYTVTLAAWASPGPPTASNAGSISAHVDVSGIGVTGGGGGNNGGGGTTGGGGSSNNPEPSTLALSLFGLTTVGAGWWRKRRTAAA
jgi:hypothetical protein